MMNMSRFLCVGVAAGALLCSGAVWASVKKGVSVRNLKSSFLTDFSSPADRVKLRQLASVCFITDAGECSGGGAGIDEPSSSSSGPGPIEPEPGKQCALEGYVNDVCPEGEQPGLACPYDSGWHTGCVCKPEYNKTCTGSDEQGKGASCNGKYKECCKLCSGYDYTASNIPSGYIKGASCQSCDGVKYKIKCDTNSSNTGTYISCGSATGGGKSCTDDNGTYYEKCTCPTNYEFNAQTQTCVCKTNFKYACTGTGYAGGQGESCDNKYQTCECATGYSWSATSGCVKCGSSFKYACTGANEVKPSGSNCGGLYDKCSCKSGYKWSGGKCVVECDSSYKYTCTGTGYAGGAGSACGGKYTQCTCASGYEWKNGSCQKILDGPHGNLCYCNGNVVGVKADGMDFFVGMKDLGTMTWKNANSSSQNYNFCNNINGMLPNRDQLSQINENDTAINVSLSAQGGSSLKNGYYWSSTKYGSGYYAINLLSSGYVVGSTGSGDVYNVRPVTTCQETSGGPDYSACKIGTLFYSDETCSYEKLSGKELLGVVVYEKTASQSGWVMTVKPVATNISWGVYGTTTGVTDKAASASCTNTQKLVALGSSYEAAITANNYSAGGKQWCLPSYDVLNNINNQTNFTKVNAGILTAGGTILGNVSSGREYVWSSSETSSSHVWEFLANAEGTFGILRNPKDSRSRGSVRPVLAF